MKWQTTIIMFLTMITLTQAYNMNDSTYLNNLDLNQGTRLNNSNYSTIINVGEPMIAQRISSLEHTSKVGWLYTLKSNIFGLSLVSPPNNFRTFETNISFAYELEIDDNVNATCYLNVDGKNNLSSNVLETGTYYFNYLTTSTYGSKDFYVTCNSSIGSVRSSTIKVLFGFTAIDIGGPPRRGGGTGSGVIDNTFTFVDQNPLDYSYIHRTDNNPTPDQKVDFFVKLNNHYFDDWVVMYYTVDNKKTWQEVYMNYDETTDTYLAQAGPYPAKTMMYYYVMAQRETRVIKTPEGMYSYLIWDNPPIVQDDRSGSQIFAGVMTVVGLVLLGAGFFMLSKKRKKQKGDSNV